MRVGVGVRQQHQVAESFLWGAVKSTDPEMNLRVSGQISMTLTQLGGRSVLVERAFRTRGTEFRGSGT